MAARSPHLDADERFQRELEVGGDPLPGTDPAPQPTGGSQPGPRLNVLLTEDRDHAEEHWTRQLPRLLEPLGIHARVATTGAEALEAARTIRFHAAVIDLATPTGQPGASPLSPPASGLWLLEVLKRSDATPPTIVINAATAPRQAQRLLNQSLRLGAFAVINRPVQLNTLLVAIQRVLERHHDRRWPEVR